MREFESLNFEGALSDLRQFLGTESPLELIKMLFISPKKLFSFPKYLSFYLDFLVMCRNGLIKKISLRILTGKKHRQIKLQRLEKVRIWAFGLLLH